MEAVRPLRPLRFRSIFISDVHLGFKGCQAQMLLDFLRSTRCEHLFLVGVSLAAAIVLGLPLGIQASYVYPPG